MAKASPKKKSPARPSPQRKTTPPPSPLPLYILSDSTGNLARHMTTAFLTQFPQDTFALRIETFIQTAPQLQTVLGQIAAAPGPIFHALVSNDLKRRIDEFCAEHRIGCRDLTGSFVSFLAEQSGVAPSADRQRLHSTDQAYHGRIEAVEFTLAHDDGLGLSTIAEAQIVLAGVSRTSKTPTSIYLAQQGYRTANVALAIQVQPPAELLALPPSKVVGLIIDPSVLVDIRSHRQTGWRMGETSYNEPHHVEEEIEWSKRLFRSRGWPILDVTNQAIEETAARIVSLLNLARASG